MPLDTIWMPVVSIQISNVIMTPQFEIGLLKR